jgi:glycosyltransferase involved in cell wall biosynthesis
MLYFPYHWMVNRWQLIKYATNIIGCSTDALRFMMGPFEKNPKCQVTLNAIPIDAFAKRIGSTLKKELCQLYGMQADAIVIGTFGRFDPLKNQKFLLQVFNHLSGTSANKQHCACTSAMSKAVLFIGGDGQLRSKLEQQRDSLSSRDRIFMPGHCTNVPKLLGNLFDCFVSTSKMEGFGLNVLEAIAAGLYVVCSDTVTKDITRAFPDRVTMLPLSAPLERWAEAIEHAIQHRIPPEQGLELVRHSPMTFEHFANEIIKIYEETITEN